MGLLDFFKRKPPPTLTPDQLRDALFDAHAARDPQRLTHLLSGYRAQILAHCLDWRNVPESIRWDRAAAGAYVDALVWLAQHLHQTGDPRLLDALRANSGDDPIQPWQDKLDQATALAKDLQHGRAIDLLNNTLIDNRHLAGSAADRYVALTHGMLGHLHFALARMSQAAGHYETALRLCEQQADAEGLRVYTFHLHDVHRYLGQPQRAADYLRRHADRLAAEGKPDDAADARRQADLIAAGEPLLRMVAVINGRSYELADTPPLPERQEVQFVFRRNRPSVTACTALVQRAGPLVAADKQDDALALLREAALIDPYDPEPHLKAALPLILLHRYQQAIDELEVTERLAPGYFQCRSDLHLARQLAAGQLSHEAVLALYCLQDARTPPAERADFARKVVKRHPLPDAHFLLGLALAELDRAAEAADAFRAGLALDPEPDVRSRLLLHLALRSADEAEARRCFAEAAALYDQGGSLMAAAGAIVLGRERLRGTL